MLVFFFATPLICLVFQLFACLLFSGICYGVIMTTSWIFILVMGVRKFYPFVCFSWLALSRDEYFVHICEL